MPPSPTQVTPKDRLDANWSPSILNTKTKRDIINYKIQSSSKRKSVWTWFPLSSPEVCKDLMMRSQGTLYIDSKGKLHILHNCNAIWEHGWGNVSSPESITSSIRVLCPNTKVSWRLYSKGLLQTTRLYKINPTSHPFQIKGQWKEESEPAPRLQRDSPISSALTGRAQPGPSLPIPAPFPIRHQWPQHNKVRSKVTPLLQMKRWLLHISAAFSWSSSLPLPSWAPSLPADPPALLLCPYPPSVLGYCLYLVHQWAQATLSSLKWQIFDWTCCQPHTMSCFSFISCQAYPFPHLVLSPNPWKFAVPTISRKITSAAWATQ